MSTPAAVLFDCDGVLVDSEGLVHAAVAAELTALGWAMDADQARHLFLGLAWPDMRPLVETRLGPLPAEWEEDFARRIAALLASQAVPVAGAPAAVERIAQAAPVAVCSNSSRAELVIKLERTGLAPL
ncbi:MAG: HAD family phosphatase, partial [Rhodovarius sp.]|nr:HAD family phosphatase [Rhodovarius sp.]